MSTGKLLRLWLKLVRPILFIKLAHIVIELFSLIFSSNKNIVVEIKLKKQLFHYGTTFIKTKINLGASPVISS